MKFRTCISAPALRSSAPIISAEMVCACYKCLVTYFHVDSFMQLQRIFKRAVPQKRTRIMSNTRAGDKVGAMENELIDDDYIRKIGRIFQTSAIQRIETWASKLAKALTFTGFGSLPGKAYTLKALTFCFGGIQGDCRSPCAMCPHAQATIARRAAHILRPKRKRNICASMSIECMKKLN